MAISKFNKAQSQSVSLKPLFKCSGILLMNPEKNMICRILEMPFTRWQKVDKQDILIFNQRTPHLSVCVKKIRAVLSDTL